MALENTVTMENGIVVNNAYCRVENINLKKDKIFFSVFKYVTTDKKPFEDQRMSAHYDLLGDNPFAQAYAYLKTLSEFAEATDV